MERIKVALAGNPNVGKTTWFNHLTGSRQHVGNWPGVTVERLMGKRNYKGMNIEFVDLPGTYSLTAYSTDEVIARNFIMDEGPDVVVHIIDASNLERNLYLTTQLMEMQYPIVLALNMWDVVEKRGDRIDTDELEVLLEIPVVKLIGKDREGIDDLLETIVHSARHGKGHSHLIGYGTRIDTYLRKLENILDKDERISKNYPLRWLSVKLIEGDDVALKRISGTKVEKNILKVLHGIEHEEMEISIADRRYDLIGRIVSKVLRRRKQKASFSDRLDSVLTNRYFGIPIFFVLMWGVFELTFTFAAPFSELIGMGMSALGDLIADGVSPDWLASVLGDGVIGGVGAVLMFLPNILVLFLMLSLLESTGYMARAAFVMDRVMYSIGLSGRSFIPMIIGFGCNVPAIMATRTIEDRKDRLITILVNPFVSCGARLPVYVLIAGIFFGRGGGTIVFLMYIIGIAVSIASAKLFRLTILRGSPAPLIMELPRYSLPSIRESFKYTIDKGYLYARKAGTVILAGSIVMWALASYTPELTPTEFGSEESMAAETGKFITPVMEPLGFDWRITVSLVFGFIAKEIVVGSLGVLYDAEDDEDAIGEGLKEDSGFSSLNALSFLIFVLLYVPCLATIAVVKQETGSWKWTTFSVAYNIGVAWLIAFMVYQGGLLLGF